MRRSALVLAVAGVALGAAGCGSEPLPPDDPPGDARLSAWRFETGFFVPKLPSAASSAPRERPRATSDADLVPPRDKIRITSPEVDERPASGAPSDAEVRAALEEAGAGTGRRVYLRNGQAKAPPDAPAKVEAIVNAANSVARKPYVYGGGHGRLAGKLKQGGLWVDTAYDCSGSVSFALANAGLLKGPMASGGFMKWGKPGKGKWVTIYANGGHMFMEVGGARFDTSGLRETGSRWQRPFRSTRGFTVRHPPGL